MRRVACLVARLAAPGPGQGATGSSCSVLLSRTLQTKSKSTQALNEHWLAAGAVGLLAGGTLVASVVVAEGEAPKPSARKITREEVAKHKTIQDRVWVTYKNGVYDITEFVAMHPGGADKIMLAAGGSIDPFWAMYQQHNKAEVQDILKEYRIGDLEGDQSQAAIQDPYSNEPSRHPALVVQSAKPFNAETPTSLLATNIVTPTDLFYVRNHLPVPSVDLEKYALTIEGEGLRTVQLTLKDLKRLFKTHTITATVQCAGNRRSEMKAVKAVKGLNWEAGAIGTATWTGVRLRDVLKFAGLDDDELGEVAHVTLEGLDRDMEGTSYAASIPVGKAMSPQGDVLLAYEMNGQPLNRDHGGPLRAVVPGIVGARNVKWLGRVVASREECQGFWQQRDYKGFSPSVDWDTVDWGSAPAIQEVPVQSVICVPEPNGTLTTDEEGQVTVSGYALSGGGRDIVRVDVSADGGNTWQAASLQKTAHQLPGRAWAWVLWQAQVEVPKESGGKLQLVCKAVDEAYNTQPDSVDAIWNLRGVVTNCWHRVTATVDDS